ncbi:MAG: M28 family peptidase [Alphaproteobacteria bacterium]|nr:M28 family peptidase [Alphaproteobacteria bacterium]
MMTMPGHSYDGPLPALDADRQRLGGQLRDDVAMLAGTIGERNVAAHARLTAAAEYVHARLARLGYDVNSEQYTVDDKVCRNLVAEIEGAGDPERIVVIGAHYDSAPGSPGADDNASAVAVLLALAGRFVDRDPALTLRWVAFANEEPPWFQTEHMGSLVHARACRQRGDEIVAMIALDGVGYYSDRPDSQHYPPPFGTFYPDTGNFIAFVSRIADRALVRRCIGAFREQASLPSEGGVGPQFITGVAWSDHWSFWQCDYPGILVTDSLPFRNPHYHGAGDRPDTLDYHRMALLTEGLQAMLAELVEAEMP